MIVNTLGNYVNIFFTALFAIVLVRIMPPEEYGVLSVLLGIAYVGANILDLGTTATIYATVPTFKPGDHPHMVRFLKSTLAFQSMISLCVLSVFAVFLPFLDRVFFKTAAPAWELYLTAATILLFIWQNLMTNMLYASQKFLRANLYINAGNIAKGIVVAMLVATHTVSSGSILFAFGVVGPVTFFVLMGARNVTMMRDFIRAPVSRSEVKLTYTLTYFAASQFYNLGTRMDLFLLSFYGMSREVGFYGLSQKIIMTVVATVVSVSQVLSPQFAGVTGGAALRTLLKKSFMYMSLPFVVFLGIILTPDWIYALVFTQTYAPSVAATKALSAAFALSTYGTIPVLYLLYTVKRPHVILMSNIFFFVIVSFGSYLLIPQWGMIGPPVAIAIGMVVAVVIQTIMIMRVNKLMVDGNNR